MRWLVWFVFLGPAAFVIATALAATLSRRGSWLVWQLVAGVLVIVVAWKIGEWRGSYDDEDPEGCSDCGETYAFALVAMLASCAARAVGTAAGGVVGLLVCRYR